MIISCVWCSRWCPLTLAQFCIYFISRFSVFFHTYSPCISIYTSIKKTDLSRKTWSSWKFIYLRSWLEVGPNLRCPKLDRSNEHVAVHVDRCRFLVSLYRIVRRIVSDFKENRSYRGKAKRSAEKRGSLWFFFVSRGNGTHLVRDASFQDERKTFERSSC